MATLEMTRPSEKMTSSVVKGEANDYLQRAINFERNRQYDEASVLYRRAVTLINFHEDRLTVDDELTGIKRYANQRLLELSLQRSPTSNSNVQYQNVVRKLSANIPSAENEQTIQIPSKQIIQDSPEPYTVMNNKDLEESNATVLFELRDGAKMFYIAKDGSIQTTNETLPLTIFYIVEENECRGLLKLGIWIYPLDPKVSPSYKTSYDAYIFPNNTSAGEFVGLMFDETVAPDVRHLFENILSQLSRFMPQNKETTTRDATNREAIGKEKNSKAAIIGYDEAMAERAMLYDTTTKSGKVASAIMTGTRFVTKQLSNGVGMAESLIERTSKTVQNKMVPANEPAKVPEGVQVAARGLRKTSEVAAKTSGLVVTKIGEMSHALARTVAPSFGKSDKRKQFDEPGVGAKLNGITGVAHAGLTSFSIIFESCENAAKHLATNLANESVNVVKYKYGEDASVLTENAAYAVGNTALTAYYINGIGAKSIAKGFVKQAAKETAKNALS